MNEVKSFFAAISFCAKTSWKVSKGYTLLRVGAITANSIFPFLNIHLIKALIDSFSANSSQTATFYIILLGIVRVLLMLTGKCNEYVQNIHRQTIQNQTQKEIMNKILDMDMQYFDSPQYQDMLFAVERDSQSLIQIVWNVYAFIGAFITLITSFVLL